MSRTRASSWRSSTAIPAGIVGIALMGQPTARASSAAAEPEKTSVARTPWGAPDLEGIWGVGDLRVVVSRRELCNDRHSRRGARARKGEARGGSVRFLIHD